MKQLVEFSLREWKEFKNERMCFYDFLDYAVVKEFEATLLIDFTRVNYVLSGGQVRKNMVKY